MTSDILAGILDSHNASRRLISWGDVVDVVGGVVGGGLIVVAGLMEGETLGVATPAAAPMAAAGETLLERAGATWFGRTAATTVGRTSLARVVPMVRRFSLTGAALEAAQADTL